MSDAPAREEKSEKFPAYRAAGVVFFTAVDGKVGDVLLSVEQRKLSGRSIGQSTGKTNADVLVFPQGRREKKDHGDPVETAMREYHEETRDFGGLSQYLLRLYDEEAPDATTAGSFLCYFAPAKMVLVFCEVPVEAYKKSLQPKPVAKAKAEPSKEV